MRHRKLSLAIRFDSKTFNEKAQVFSEALMDILGNLIPHKSLKFNYKQTTWMNPKSFSSLRKRTKPTKLFYKNMSDSLKEVLMSKSTEWLENYLKTQNKG